MDFENHRLNRTNSQLAIGKNNSKPIANSQLVDTLLETYKDLIDPNYAKWFASRFYYMEPELVEHAASEARSDGNDPKRLFAFIIRKRSR